MVKYDVIISNQDAYGPHWNLQQLPDCIYSLFFIEFFIKSLRESAVHQGHILFEQI